MKRYFRFFSQHGQTPFGAALAGVLILSLSGCSLWKTNPIIPLEERSLENVLAIVESNYQRLDHLKGRGRLILEMSERSMTLDVHVIVDRPDTFYIRLEALFGLDVGWLLVAQNKYTFYSPIQNSYSTGHTDSLKTGRFLDFNIDADHLLGSLAGIELAKNIKNGQVVSEGKFLVLEGMTEMGRQKHWIDCDRGVIIRSELYDSTGQTCLKATYERFSRINGVNVPRTVRLKRPLERQGVTIFYEQLYINERLSAKDYKLKIPTSARKVTH